MDDQSLDLLELLAYQNAMLTGIRAELRAMRLEACAMMGGKLTDIDAAGLKEALDDADEVAHMFSDDYTEPAELNA